MWEDDGEELNRIQTKSRYIEAEFSWYMASINLWAQVKLNPKIVNDKTIGGFT